MMNSTLEGAQQSRSIACMPLGVTITVCASHEAICGTLSEKFAATLKLEPPLQERGLLQALE